MPPKKQAPKFGHWCGTCNNPTVEQLRDLWVFNEKNSGPVPDSFPLAYISLGWEHFTPGTGTPHLQIYFELGERTRCRLAQLAKWFPGTHWEERKRSAQKAREYTQKDGVFRERGECAENRYAHSIAEFWADLIAAIQEKSTFAEVVTDPELVKHVAGRMAWAKMVWGARPTSKPELNMAAVGYQWQAPH